MKNYFIKTAIVVTMIFVTNLLTNCSSDNTEEHKNDVLLVQHESKTLGWGKGGQNTAGYLGLSEGNGNIITFLNVDKTDEATQKRVDIVFPGDSGSNGGGLTIGAPNSDGLGGAAIWYCKDWIRKNGTRIAELDNTFDLSTFEKVKTVPQILALDKKAFYSNWDYPGIGGGGQGKTLLIRTYTGYLALLFIEKVQGTYGDEQAKVTVRIKVTHTMH